MLERMKKENFYAYEHPFLNENSPFYKNTDDSIIKRVDISESNPIPPTWDVSENIHLYQL